MIPFLSLALSRRFMPSSTRVSSTIGRVGVAALAAVLALPTLAATATGQARRHRRSSAPLAPLRPRPVALALVVQQSVLSNGMRVSCSTERQVTESAASLLVPLGSRGVRPGLAQSFAALGSPPPPIVHARTVLEEELTGYVMSAPAEAFELALYALAQRMVVPRSVAAGPYVSV